MTKADMMKRLNDVPANGYPQSCAILLVMNWLQNNGHADIVEALKAAMIHASTIKDANSFAMPMGSNWMFHP